MAYGMWSVQLRWGFMPWLAVVGDGGTGGPITRLNMGVKNGTPNFSRVKWEKRGKPTYLRTSDYNSTYKLGDGAHWVCCSCCFLVWDTGDLELSQGFFPNHQRFGNEIRTKSVMQPEPGMKGNYLSSLLWIKGPSCTFKVIHSQIIITHRIHVRHIFTSICVISAVQCR